MNHTKISAEEKAYQKIPVINDFKDRNGNDIMMQQIQRNYDQIKADAQAIINEEMRRIKMTLNSVNDWVWKMRKERTPTNHDK